MDPMLDFDLLRTFVFIAETGSLSRAATCVHRTQSAVSMQVRRLEETIGKPLLERSSRGVRLTAPGERMLRQAQKLLRLHDETLSDLTGEDLSGLARFGLADDYAEAFLPPLIGTFAARYPRIGIEVSCSPTPDLRHSLKAGRLDLAVLTLASNSRERVMRRERLVWVAATNGSTESIEPLPLALSHREAVDRRAALRALKKAGRTHRVAYESGSSAGLIAVVRSGLAIAVLARCSVPKDLRILTDADGLPSLPSVDIVLALGRAISPPARRLAEHVSSMLPTLVS
jgi:DNA-binding transcriptional LysR family regulator